MAGEDERAEELVEVVVTATRIPAKQASIAASIDRIEVDANLRAYQGTDFAELLEAVPGLFVQSRYNSAQDL
ncbi:MAG: hypothetical protein HKN59_06945, partial [Gammaproteobacteria bacterium]|nr:hypothetical protein [Gammaproteobacteria bacterium]